VRCHSVSILSDFLASDEHAAEALRAKQCILAFFFQEIADRQTGKLKRVDHIHPSVVLSVFQAVAACATVSANALPGKYLRAALQQLDGTEIGPALLLCFNRDHFWCTDAEVRANTETVMAYASGSGDSPPLMCAAAKVFNRAPGIFSQPSVEKIKVLIITHLHDHLLHVETRIALLESLVVNFGHEAYLTVFQCLTRELRTPSPDYYFVTRVLRIAGLLKGHHTAVTRVANQRSGLREMFTFLHQVIIDLTDTHFALLQQALAVYTHVFQRPWTFKQVPDGVIRAQPVTFMLGQELKFSDSD
jgi:hypothetical protein